MRRAQIAVAAVVAALLVVAWRLGIFARFGSPAEVKSTLLALGPWGYAAFIIAYALLQPFGVPGTVFIIAAPLIWPWPVAFATSMTGTMAASIIGFSFARFVARDWVAARIPQRFRQYDDALARRAFATVLVLRLVFWMPPLLHAFFGVSKVRFSTHAYASALGYVLPLFLVSYFGEQIFERARAMPLRGWLVIAAVLAAMALASWALRRKVAR